MPDDTLLLVGRETGRTRVYDRHAARLRDRDVATMVEVATYGTDPVADLRADLDTLETDRVFVVPVCSAHTHETTDAVPRALSYLDAETHYCEPVGRHPSVTDALVARAESALAPSSEAGLALVGLGNSAGPYSRRMVETHADRLRERTGYGAVRSCYLLQNPAVECVRYSLPTNHAVAVPVFIAPDPETLDSIADRLEVDRGGIEIADPLDTHPAVTDAIEAGLHGERAASGQGPTSFENALAGSRSPLATDGEG